MFPLDPSTCSTLGAIDSLSFWPIRKYATCSAFEAWSHGDAAIPQKPKRRNTRPVVRVQYGALPYRFTPTAALEILVVTTRQSRQWIVPKGWPIKRLSPAKSAAREAFEEAGLRGTICGKHPIGAYHYEKQLPNTRLLCEVHVFLMWRPRSCSICVQLITTK